MKHIIKIKGLDCANCARELEEELNKIESVSAQVEFINQKVKCDCDDKYLEEVKYAISHFEEVEIVEEEGGKHIVKIKGLDCANCARELEEELNKIESVSAQVDFINQKVKFDCDEKHFDEVIYTISHFEEVEIIKDEPTKDIVIKIEGLDCANCARELEEELNKIDGIEANVDFILQKVKIAYDKDSALAKAKYAINHFEEVKIVEEEEKKGFEQKWDLIRLIVSFVIFLPAFIMSRFELPLYAKIIEYVLFIASYIVVGYEVLINTVKNVAKGKVFDENFLMAIASVGAIVLGFVSGGDGLEEGVMVMFLYELGEFLQSLAVGSSRNSIVKLMNLKSETAIKIVDGKQEIVTPEELNVGDIVLIKVGDKVPVDGIIVDGNSSLDLKSLNGEAMPKDVKEGDKILSGSINISKAIQIKVIREYKDSAVKKILDLVENSAEKKTKSEKFITKFAKYYTPAVCALALVVATIVPTIIGAVQGNFVWELYSRWIYNALCFLVISCPCALVISVPLAYFGGIGAGARNGVLVKGSTSLDELANASVAAFDKTGTLTKGEFSVINYSSKEAYEIASIVEKYSSHPIAKAFKDNIDGKVEGFKEVSGRGIECKLNGEKVLLGNYQMMVENNINVVKAESIAIVIYVAKSGKFIGYVEIDDVIKDGAKEALALLKKEGVEYITMLSGDSKERAMAIAKELNLDGVEGGLLPNEKLDKAKELKQKGGLIYVGDGINDAPVMMESNCAISMGSIGSDAAIEASDIVLVSDDLSKIAKAKRVAKKTKKIVLENIVGSLFVKFAIMILDLSWGAIVPGGVFPLIVSVIADVGVMLLAVLNSMRLLIKK